MIKDTIHGLATLTYAEKLSLVEELWDELSIMPEKTSILQEASL